ncbi:MAG: MarC family NAAT transporter [Opitutaceae bacterium]|jgi:multiple antibiotic resistance protein|nr:MarC family NAAT transporter [Opitutaceae bacterium]
MYESLFKLWGLFLGTIVGILPIMNPFAAAPTFLAITTGDSAGRRAEQARKASIYVAMILSGALLFGSLVMNFFGISIPGFRIAGGIAVAGIGMRMLMPDIFQHKREKTAEHAEALAKSDVSFSPMAMPILSGPGSIGVTIGFASLATTWLDYAAIILGILTVALACYLTLRVAIRMNGILGPTGISAMTQIMGLLIMCMGVQFVVNGVVSIATDPKILTAIRDVLFAPPVAP